MGLIIGQDFGIVSFLNGSKTAAEPPKAKEGEELLLVLRDTYLEKYSLSVKDLKTPSGWQKLSKALLGKEEYANELKAANGDHETPYQNKELFTMIARFKLPKIKPPEKPVIKKEVSIIKEAPKPIIPPPTVPAEIPEVAVEPEKLVEKPIVVKPVAKKKPPKVEAAPQPVQPSSEVKNKLNDLDL